MIFINNNNNGVLGFDIGFIYIKPFMEWPELLLNFQNYIYDFFFSLGIIFTLMNKK